MRSESDGEMSVAGESNKTGVGRTSVIFFPLTCIIIGVVYEYSHRPNPLDQFPSPPKDPPSTKIIIA